MNEQRNCPQCGRPLPSDTPGGLCPACLLKRGLESNTIGETAGEKSARWSPPPVEVLAGSFPELDILELIGRGGMGAVYKARQKELDRLVALKILPPEIGQQESFAQRFAREAQAMAKLSHPNIVTIHDFGQRGGLYFFLMEYVDGLSLRQLLDAGTVSPTEAIAIVPQICDALQYAHDRGIVHRDIKPENILMNRQGQVKIADFGLAKLVGLPPADATAVAEKVMGTPQYMAPEQIDRPGEVDHRADIYSLGVVFYQMLTGELPVGSFEPPSRKVLIDVRLDEVVLRALEKEPARRYQQVSEIRTQVETIVATAGQRPADSAALSNGPGHPAVYGWEYRSKKTLFGLPLVHVAEGLDPATGKAREARGIIAYGGKAKGVVAIGGQAVGVIAFGGFAIGIISLGGFSLGLLSFGGLVGGLLFAYGGVALAPLSMGGIAAGYYSQGGFNLGVQRLEGHWIVYASILFYSLMGALLLAMAPLKVLGRRCRPKPQHSAGQVAGGDRVQRVEHARHAVRAPAIGLIVASVMNWLTIFVLVPLVLPAVSRTGCPLPVFFLAVVILILGSSVILVGALKMQHLESLGLARTGSILAMIVGPGYLVGWPMGIWALVVLSRREVIEAFAACKTSKAVPSKLSVLLRWAVSILIVFTLIGLTVLATARVLLPPKPHKQVRDSVATQPTTQAEKVSFGPVIERVVYDDGVGKDYLIDFDTGILYAPPEEFQDESKALQFIRSKGIDAMGETASRFFGLAGFDMIAIPASWDGITPERVRKELLIGEPGTPALISGKGELPVAYVFQTREGSAGVLQITEIQHQQKPRFIKIRYKLLQPSPTSTQPATQPATQAASMLSSRPGPQPTR